MKTTVLEAYSFQLVSAGANTCTRGRKNSFFVCDFIGIEPGLYQNFFLLQCLFNCFSFFFQFLLHCELLSRI